MLGEQAQGARVGKRSCDHKCAVCQEPRWATTRILVTSGCAGGAKQDVRVCSTCAHALMLGAKRQYDSRSAQSQRVVRSTLLAARLAAPALTGPARAATGEIGYINQIHIVQVSSACTSTARRSYARLLALSMTDTPSVSSPMMVTTSMSSDTPSATHA